MIIENKINDIIDYKIKVNRNYLPRSANKLLPPFFYSALFIGATGTGKTFKLVELLKLYEKYDILDSKGNKLNMRIVLFCTTANSKANAVYNVLHIPEEDIILKYSDDKLEEKLNEVKEEQKNSKEYNLYIEAYKKFHKYDDVDVLTDDELQLLDKYGMDEPFANYEQHSSKQKDLKRRPEKVYFFIFDDLLGTSAFKIRSESKLNNLVTLCRHHSINLMFTTQYLTAIPPIIRNNVRLWVVFKFSNSERLLKHVYPEISNLVKEEKFLELYEHATNNDHDSLIIINHNDMDKKFRIRKNWNHAIEYN
jgi:hypothetical protein